MVQYVAICLDSINDNLEETEPTVLGIFNSEFDAYECINNTFANYYMHYKKVSNNWPLIIKRDFTLIAVNTIGEKFTSKFIIKAVDSSM